jgi:hypothetical protein
MQRFGRRCSREVRTGHGNICAARDRGGSICLRNCSEKKSAKLRWTVAINYAMMAAVEGPGRKECTQDVCKVDGDPGKRFFGTGMRLGCSLWSS